MRPRRASQSVSRSVARQFEAAYATTSNEEILAEKGFDPVYGARPLRRAVERYIENPLSTRVLKGDFKEGVHVYIGVYGDGLIFKKKKAGKTKKKVKAST